MKKIRIGTRGSSLALAQAQYVSDLLQKLEYSTELVIIKTTGDINYQSFSEISKKGDEAKGLFTKEIEEALLRDEIDIAVHSLKDVPTKSPEELVIAALPQRLDFRDYWVFLKEKKIQAQFPFIREDGFVGTSSFRRKSLIRFLFPSLRFLDIRGNVPTRIKKLFNPDGPDAILLSGAGIERLQKITNWIEDSYLKNLEIIPLDPEVFPPAPGQGTLAVQCKKKNTDLLSILSKIHNHKIEEVINIERGILAKLEGGCHLPLGVYGNKDESGYSVKLFLGREYPYSKKKKDFYIKRYHKNSKQLIKFVYEELTQDLPIVIFGKREKNQKLISIFQKEFHSKRLIFFDVMEVYYHTDFIKKIDYKNLYNKFTIFCIFSVEGIFSLKINEFQFPNLNFYIFLNGNQSKNVLLQEFPEIHAEKIFISKDGTAKGIANQILEKFSPKEIQIITIKGKDKNNEFYEILKDYSVKSWIVYETKVRNLTKEEVLQIPKKSYLIFGSPSLFNSFYQSFQGLNFKELSSEWRLVALGNTTFEHISRYKLPVYAKGIQPDYELLIKEFL